MILGRLVRAAAIVAVATPLAGFSPSNVECIAPANPGGGWDFTCRSVGKLLHDLGLVPQPVQVTNMAGGVGAVAYANVASKRSDDPNLIVAASTVGITQIAQGKYPAGADAMRWVGMLGADVGVVMVQKDSPLNSINDLLEAYKADPDKLVAGGSSNVGGWDHLRLLMLADKAGMATDDLKRIKWVQYSGGGDAVTQLLGGHVQVVLTDIGEIAGFIQSGDVKVLAVMADDRLPAFGDLPTAKEQGVDVTGYNWRGFYMPGKISDEAYNAWVEAMKKLYDSPEWQKTAVDNGLTPIWRGGAEFEAFVRDSEATMRNISKAIGVIN